MYNDKVFFFNYLSHIYKMKFFWTKWVSGLDATVKQLPGSKVFEKAGYREPKQYFYSLKDLLTHCSFVIYHESLQTGVHNWLEKIIL